MEALVILVLCIVVCAGGAVHSIRSSIKKSKQQQADAEAWVEDQKKNGEKWYVQVTLVGGAVRVSTNVEPDYYYFWDSYTKRTSRQRAEEWAERISRGATFNVGLEHFPHSQIAKVEVCKN